MRTKYEIKKGTYRDELDTKLKAVVPSTDWMKGAQTLVALGDTPAASTTTAALLILISLIHANTRHEWTYLCVISLRNADNTFHKPHTFCIRVFQLMIIGGTQDMNPPTKFGRLRRTEESRISGPLLPFSWMRRTKDAFCILWKLVG